MNSAPTHRRNTVYLRPRIPSNQETFLFFNRFVYLRGGDRPAEVARKGTGKAVQGNSIVGERKKSGMYNLGRLFLIDFPCLAACWNRAMIGWWKAAGDDGWTLGARHQAAATYSTLTVPPGSLKYNNGAGTSFFSRLLHTHAHHITLLPAQTLRHLIHVHL